MPSVENFYWILYQNLLKPVGLDCWYYYPWGTKDNLSRAGEFKKFYRRSHGNHVLFHFDQEPLWNKHLGNLYDQELGAWNVKMVRVLANSEHSVFKKQILSDREMLDWYFFYHGFAALDWYQDAKYTNHDFEIQYPFVSFNHVIAEQRSYRLDLISRLIDHGVANLGQISLHTSHRHIRHELDQEDSMLATVSKQRIQKNLMSLDDLPWTIDDVHIDGKLSARFGHQEYELWQRCFLHVVNETVFYQSKLHLTEKIFKPIVAKRPFVLVAAPGNLAYLRSYGFRTFTDWIDESYDAIVDPDLRLEAITKEIIKLSQFTIRQLRELHQDMQAILDFNKQHFFNNFRHIIVNELVDNFDTCVRVWNNGRVDGREIPAHPDLKSVRNLLLQ